MARHGECAPVSSLSRKFPDLGPVSTPEGFVAFVRSKGLKVAVQSSALQGVSVQEVSVPERELSLVFVPAKLCSGAGGR